jgi:hypothetical protein
MDYEAIGVAAVEWRKAEDDKAEKRKAFIAAHVAAVKEHGQPCAGRCEGGDCHNWGGHQCAIRSDVQAATRQQYDAWAASANAARSARTVLTRRIRREQGKAADEAERLAQQQKQQGALF